MEKFAKEEMETGDKSITDCYDNLLFSLTNIHPGQAEGSSPIIKKRKAEQHGPKDENGPKTNKAKVDEVKTSSLGGISIRVEGEEDRYVRMCIGIVPSEVDKIFLEPGDRYD